MLNNPLCVKDGRFLYLIGTRGTTREKKVPRDQSHEEKKHRDRSLPLPVCVFCKQCPFMNDPDDSPPSPINARLLCVNYPISSFLLDQSKSFVPPHTKNLFNDT
jgi:hypothetical protein